MLLWIEEAAIEGAMILSVVVGTTVFILATWSALDGWLHPAKAEPIQRRTGAHSAEVHTEHDSGSQAA
jgi:hypothetical protein